jgi:hypothetical protein
MLFSHSIIKTLLIYWRRREKRKLFEENKQLQIDGDTDQQPFEQPRRVACNISAIKDEHSTDNIVPDCADESSDKLTGLKDNILRDLSSIDDIQFDHVNVPLLDSLDTDLMTVLSETLDKIDNALGLSHSANIDTSDIHCKCNDSTTVRNHVRICLVHCAKGANCSTSIVVGYLLSRYPDVFPSFDYALGHMRKVRPHALPNVRFAFDLRWYAKDIHK